jgi:hypothetical protein
MQGIGQLGRQFRGLARRRSVCRRLISQRYARYEIAHQVRPAVMHTDFVNRDNARVSQVRRVARLAREAFQAVAAS